MATLPLLIGHRGARATAGVPENTPASFDLALEHGCDGVEFDVRRTADGQALLCHDPISDGIKLAGAQASQLPQLPRLEQVIEQYGRRAFLDIELKVADVESKVLAALDQNPPVHGCVVSSFLPGVVVELRARSTLVTTGIICETAAQLARWRRLPVDYVIVHYALVGAKLLQEVSLAGRRILVWTVNDRGAMKRMAGLGVDGIISDETELLVRTLKHKQGKSGRRTV